VWSAPGAALMIRLAPDEQTLNVQAANSKVITGAWADNIATLKFLGCAVPQMVFVIAHKTSNDETRTYVFSMETVPPICSPDISGPVAQPNIVSTPGQAQGPIANASLVDGQAAETHTLEAKPDLIHLEHPADLAEGGHIPYAVTIRYPGDERVKRNADDEKSSRIERKRRVERALSEAASGIAPTTGFINHNYAGRGDQTIRPAANYPLTTPVMTGK
jgi:hypothetical protein